MDALDFIQRPVRWLRLLSEHPDAIAAAPNFAYDHCVRRVRERDRESLRLEHVRALINGSEPVRASTLAAFDEAFRRCGLRPGAQRPSYGLAEATVFVSTAEHPSVTRFDVDLLGLGRAVAVPDAERGVTLVSAGRPVGQHLVVVDPQRELPCEDGEVGEIWLSGNNVAAGYWGSGEGCGATFGAMLAAPPPGAPAGPWLRTGDLGAIHRGELYLTGRRKDLMIIDGRNHYPHDIEQTVEAAHPAVRSGRVVAFSVPGDDGEELVLVAERALSAGTDPDTAAARAAIARDVARHHGIGLADLVLVRPNTVPRTSSGKLARSDCRRRYLDGTLALAGAVR